MWLRFAAFFVGFALAADPQSPIFAVSFALIPSVCAGAAVDGVQIPSFSPEQYN